MDFDPQHPLHIGPISGKPHQCILSGFNGHGMAVILFAAKKVTETVKEEKGYGRTGRSRLCRTSQEDLQSGENKFNFISVDRDSV